jgi:outer membrane protein
MILLVGVVHGQSGQMNLRQCVDAAVNNNLQIIQGQANMAVNEAAVKQSRLALLPNLNFSASYFFSYGRGLDYVTNTYVAQSFQSNNYLLSSNLGLYQGGVKSNSIRKAEYDLQAAELDQQALLENIQLNTILAFLQVMFAEDQVTITNNRIEVSRRQLSDSEKLVEAGSIPEGNLLNLKAQIAADELELVNARNQVANAYLNLKNLMQMEPGQPLEIIYPTQDLLNEVLNAQMPTLNEVIDAAIDNLPGIQRFEYAIKSAEADVKIAGGYGLPSLTAVGQLNTSFSDANIGIPGFEPDPYADQLENNLGEVVGLTLSIPIFNNGQVAISKQNAELGLLNAELQRQIAVNDLKTTVTDAWTGLQAAAISYESAQKSLEASRLAFEFAEKRFQAGAASALDYTTAANNLASAEVSMNQAKFNYIFQRKVIDYYLGKPIEF